MKRIVVFGSNGQLGKTLKSIIKKEPNEYVFCSKKDVDITDKSILERVFNEQNFDFCVNCAAYTNVEGAEKKEDEAFLINAKGVKNIAEVCALYDVKLIHISTDYVFDGKKKNPYKTSDKPNPINQYGKSKLKGEFYIKETLKQYYIIRTSWLYSIYGKNFLKTIINSVVDNKPISITTKQQGTPTSCLDLSEFIKFIINNSISYGVYNFSARGNTSWYGFAKEIVQHYCAEKTNIISSTNNFVTLANRPKYSVLDVNNTERVYKELNKWQHSVKTIVEIIKNDNYSII
ncbi:dTDP-4-dehydrorhamnose reductase [uncultured Winogradskyella sp.]|uniref:dTDP-4-dehydrorhamnose reductase n=1 Tax=uncultured Winogradskyella sp. TaxID=395353 RepID=UPI00260B7A68|nr:dTDP-4-dehydrorhamnose reductase [uncultured Winogradskyella sp.]